LKPNGLRIAIRSPFASAKRMRTIKLTGARFLRVRVQRLVGANVLLQDLTLAFFNRLLDNAASCGRLRLLGSIVML